MVTSLDHITIRQELKHVNTVLLVGEKDTIFCDFFDTLVVRKVQPEQIKKIVMARLQELLSLEISAGQLYLLRAEIERNLCANSLQNGKDAEFSLVELGQALYDELLLRKVITTKLSAEDFKKALLDLEISVEVRCQELDKDVYDSLTQWKQQGLQLILVSDFYLPSEYLAQILRFHGLEELFTRIYVSADYHLTKRSGRLYQLIVQELKLLESRVIMIGDNAYSDYQMPTALGISAFLLSRIHQYKFYTKFAIQADSYAFFKHTISELFSSTSDRLFEGLILSLFVFIARLYASLYQANVQDVFFLAREGEYLIKLFEIYQSAFYPEHKIKLHYLKVSRKATFIPSLGTLEQESFERLFRQYRTFSLRSFLLSLNFDTAEQDNICQILAKDADLMIEDFPQSETFKALLKLNIFQQLYEKTRIEQRENFLAYLKSFGVDFTKQALHLVDVGWKGTIQDNIRCMVPKETAVAGHYLGLVWAPMVSPINSKEGLLFSCQNKRMPDFGIFDENKSLFEVFLGASHGSAGRYVKTGEKVDVVLAEHKDEQDIFTNHVQPLQQQLLAKFHTLAKHASLSSVSLAQLYPHFLAEHQKLVFSPNKRESNWFHALKHYENFGVFNFSRFSAGDVSFSQKIKNVYFLLTSPRKFLTQVFWPVLSFDYVFFPGGRQIYRLIRYVQFFFTRK